MRFTPLNLLFKVILEPYLVMTTGRKGSHAYLAMIICSRDEKALYKAGRLTPYHVVRPMRQYVMMKAS